MTNEPKSDNLTFAKVTYYLRGVLHVEGGLSPLAAQTRVKQLSRQPMVREIKVTEYAEDRR
jgi:hypothetical protein